MTRELLLHGFEHEIAIPLLRGTWLPVSVRMRWCYALSQISAHALFRQSLLRTVIQRLHGTTQGESSVLWCATRAGVKRVYRQLRMIWYHHPEDFQHALDDARRRTLEVEVHQVVLAHVAGLPPLASPPASLPAELWQLVAEFAIDTVQAAVAWRHSIGGKRSCCVPRPLCSISHAQRCLMQWSVTLPWFERLFAVHVLGYGTVHLGECLDKAAQKLQQLLRQYQGGRAPCADADALHVRWRPERRWSAVRAGSTLESLGAPLTLRNVEWRLGRRSGEWS